VTTPSFIEWSGVRDDRTAMCVGCAGRVPRATSSLGPPPPKSSTPAVASASAGAGSGVTTSARLMRRSASFDTIAGFYLAGRWPCRDPSTIMASLINAPIVLTLDKSTQVNTGWVARRKMKMKSISRSTRLCSGSRSYPEP